MHEFESRFGHWVIRARWPIILLSLVLVLLAASGGRNLSFTTNYRVFFSSDNPQLLAFEALENTYSKNDNVMFVLAPRDGNVFTPRTLKAVQELTHQAWQIPYSTRVDSITNFQHTFAEGDDLIVQDLVPAGGELDTVAIARIREIALNEPLLARRIISERGQVTAVNATIQLPGKNEATETPEVVQFARGLADQMRADYPEIEVRMTGMAMMNNAFSEASKHDMQSLVLLSFVLMLVILAVLLKGLTATGVTLLVILFSILTAMGLGGYMGIPLTPPSATAPTIILTVAIANSVHVLVTLLHEIRSGRTKYDAIVESLRVNLAPVALASLTTAIGFLCMNFSEVPPFRHLGNLVAIGVATSFILAVTLLPALMSLLPVSTRVHEPREDHAMARLGNFVVNQRRKLLWGMLGLIVVLVAFIPRNELNDVFLEYFDTSVPFRADSDFTVKHLTGLYTIDYSLESGEAGGISNPAFLSDVQAFADWYRAQPETIHVNAITDVFRRLNRNMHGDDDAYYRLPQERNLAAQYLLLYEMSLPYGLDLNNQINVDKSSTRVTVTTQTLSTNDLLALEARAQAWLDKNTSQITGHEGSGPSVMFGHIGKRNIRSMLLGSTFALLLISVLLMFALRSFSLGAVSMLPNLVPAAMGFGLWGLFVGEVGLALSVVTSMTIGIVVDDTVHFLSKYLRARREKGYSAPQAVRYAFNTVGRALLITSIVLVVGFLVLAFSTFKVNSGMGTLTAIVIAFALMADFLFLPPLLIKLQEKQDEKARLAVDAQPARS
ncbi:MAG: MMPL family transporter [Gammaproteobacteria bacterium]|nr:MMPL family transporter [Gammaproteobacteria bacterium]